MSQIKNAELKREPGDISSLKASITELGLINPLTIDEDYNLLAGGRRYQAIKKLGWQDVEVLILPVNGDQLKAYRVAIDENLKRKPLTDPENRAVIATYDELKREKEGVSKGGQRTDLTVSEPETDLYHTVVEVKGWSQTKTAEDLHISQQAVSEAIQAEAIIKIHPELAGKKTKQVIRVAQVEAQEEKIKQLDPLEGLFDVIVVDPPWQVVGDYDPDGRRATPAYPMMNFDEIAGIELPTAKDCILWLWVTNLNIHDGFHLLERWEFVYKNMLTWAKDKLGLGSWLRGQTENCLLATKGHPLFKGEATSTLLVAPRTTHSTKPEAFYELVEKTCIGRKLDYFSRKARDGWTCYGNNIG